MAVVGGVGELTLEPAAAVAKHECTLLHTSYLSSTLNSWQITTEVDKSNYKQSCTPSNLKVLHCGGFWPVNSFACLYLNCQYLLELTLS